VAKAKIERAVALAQLYCGSLGLPIKTQQRFYDRMMRAVQGAAKSAGTTATDAFEQIDREARRRGCTVPRPGKDY